MSAPEILIIGAGVSGLYAALKCASLPVRVIAPSMGGDSGSSHYAQGGIAAAIGEDDNPAQHLADTIKAGAGLVDEEAARVVVDAAPAIIDDLVQLGAPFDRDASGALLLAKEAAHSHARVVHLGGDRSGALLMQTLCKAAQSAEHITLETGLQALTIAVHEGRACGVWLMDEAGALHYRAASAMIMATGGIGGLFAQTTNPKAVSGQGIGMAARAGARLRDMAFVQFHPTALSAGGDPLTLVTEALRGAGAALVTQSGQRLTQPDGGVLELAPRDVVARAIDAAMRRGEPVFLDASEALGERFAKAFPQVYAACMAAEIDPARERIPVTPAAHYSIGGIAANVTGQTSLEGLYAIGEAACTGMHGANRLASNSLLEGLAMGSFCAQLLKANPLGQSCEVQPPAPDHAASAGASDWLALRELASREVGIVRSYDGLCQAKQTLLEMTERHARDVRFNNSAAALMAAINDAMSRRESIGCHYLRD